MYYYEYLHVYYKLYIEILEIYIYCCQKINKP